MIKKILAATVLLFGLGLNVASAQTVIQGPKDYEKLMMQHAVVCSGVEGMQGFLDENSYFPVFRGKNEIASLGTPNERKPSTSFADIYYSDKMKSAITLIYDRKADVACIISGIGDVKVNEQGVNATLGYKN